ncbi:LysR family transcriptional regulator [Erwinia sp. OLTSP20]|uniref:DNA-binding transcriptional activator PunR n=1 Tax=unclassified Erwinia TaxID=2622719 RepID=UPI000C1A6FD7|nr:MULTISPECIES: DNA-binding transcriptional activator PunR [unclassified Erwinia]PIJ51822.1 LysR family transcriptional regulator [Erwinia sp. OAMSP11]PIJ74410.1 LysR family transcriptional regulator [Erwinia sp. OLSSP12]PIJ83757.1 LysR family transcriptional regulator [Erwinia sp. OLCASP19]PIJ86800.1 LysR family transcriptional regulator [Erwinia sp. OLMTSP26]PIJ88207.1 LysR family transcriptional regulator [Erwinia sp. OLMDSP33]
MWSEHVLEVVDAVARSGSFSAAAQALNRVPSAVSYTVRQLENWLGVALFERRHRDVVLTPAGKIFLEEGRAVIKIMHDTRRRCQQLVKGWQGELTIAIDRIVKPARTRQLVCDFYRHFPEMELHISHEVFNGVWDALADGRVEVAIGATQAVPVGGQFAFRDMGYAHWRCLVSASHPLAAFDQPLNEETIRAWPSLVMEDTARTLPRRTTWTLDNQQRRVVPDWETAFDCLEAGLGVGMVPGHLARAWQVRGALVELRLETPFPPSPCCLSWRQNNVSPALSWLLSYLGDADTLNSEWLQE